MTETAEAESPPKAETGGMSTLPQALEGREALVELTTVPGVSVLVQRWSWTKVKAMVRMVFDAFKERSDGEVQEILSGETAEIASNVFDILEDRAFNVVRESVRQEDRQYISPDMDAGDVLNLFSAALEINEGFIDSLKKKGPGILRRFGLDSLLAKAKDRMSSTPSRPPSGS